MWFTRNTEAETETDTDTTLAAACRHTLVVHADGSQECEGVRHCGGDELWHEWSLPCDELACGCAGQEHDLTVGIGRAA